MARPLLLASLLAALAAPAQAQPVGEPASVTRHAIHVGGKALAYVAEAGRIAIRDAGTGEPHGFMFYTAYRVESATPRPVTFIWNGGPGAPSTLLHFAAAGPRRAEGGGLVDNAETWLTASDLVFVDPIGTGYSRPTKTEYGDEFYGTVGDVASVTEFVRAWRSLHDAEASPLYLAGESWGAGRAANVGAALLKRGIKVDGLVLISGGYGLGKPPVPGQEMNALRVANLAATGLAFGRVQAASQEAARTAAEAWVRETYLPALKRADQLTDAERDGVVAGLARVTGLPADRIDRKTLAVTPRQFRTDLVAGKTLDTFDMRLTGSPRELMGEPILRYFRGDLAYRTDLSYLGLEPIEQGWAPGGKYPAPVNARWNYATAPMAPDQVAAAIAEAQRTGAGPPELGPPLPGTAEAVGLNPKLKVLVAQGIFDSLGNCAGAEEIGRRLDAPLKAAMRFRCYQGGHMMYLDPPSRVALSRDVRALISGTLP